MATNHYNISGTTTTVLLSAGDRRQISRISLTNISDTNDVTVDLFIQKVNLGKFHLLSNMVIPVGVTLIYNDMTFSTRENDFSLYIKCTGTSPLVDVIMN
tara:strand:- start:153 stop:452 length:300 start_codon:yes stop_codon:yes gene_type:complete